MDGSVAKEWGTYVTLILSSISIGYLGYILNRKNRILTYPDGTRKLQYESHHTFFYIPIEYWAIIIPLIFWGVQHHSELQYTEDMKILESPAINDKYLVDYSKFYKGYDKETKFGIVRVVSVSIDEIEVQQSEIVYNKKSGVSEDIRKGIADQSSYYINDLTTLTRDKLASLRKENGIYEVNRK